MERERNRYIVFEAFCSHEIIFKELTSAIWREIDTLYGEYGTSKAGLWLMSLERGSLEKLPESVRDSATILRYKGILRTNHRNTDLVRTALAFITEINGKSTLIHVLGISGTLKAARKKYH